MLTVLHRATPGLQQGPCQVISAIVAHMGMSDGFSLGGLQALLVAVERALQAPRLMGLRLLGGCLRPAWALGACTSLVSARAAAAWVAVARRAKNQKTQASTSQALPAASLPSEHRASLLTVQMCI